MQKNSREIYITAGIIFTILLQLFCSNYIILDAISFIVISVIYMFLFTVFTMYLHIMIVNKNIGNEIYICSFCVSSIILIATICIGTRGNIKNAELNFILCLISLIVFFFSIHNLKLNKEITANINEA